MFFKWPFCSVVKTGINKNISLFLCLYLFLASFPIFMSFCFVKEGGLRSHYFSNSLKQLIIMIIGYPLDASLEKEAENLKKRNYSTCASFFSV